MATNLKGRRQALAALAAVALHSGRSAFAQAPRQIAVLHWNSRNGNTAAVRKEFPEAMAELGHVQGRNVVYEMRFSDRDFTKMEALAGEIVRSRPDAIIAHLSLTTRALAQSTSTIPIVAYISDPVMEGYSRDGVMPSRNVTGVADFWGERVTKLLEALKAIIPGFSRFAVVASKRDAQILDFLALAERTSLAMGIQQHNIMVSSSPEIEEAFAAMPGKGIKAAMTMDLWHLMPAPRQAELSIRQGVALVGRAVGGGVKNGELLHLGADFENQAAPGSPIRRLVAQLDKVLRGTPVGKIPFEFPRRFILAVNLKTAAALKLRIPQEVLLRADRIIE